MYDVIVVGGGPAGLFLATELRLAGATPLVLERSAEPDTGDKAHGVTGQSVRLLDHRGLYERCGGRGAPRPAPGFYYAGMPLPLPVLGPDNPVYLLPVNQRDLERVLAARAAELGVEVRRGWAVRSVSQDDDRAHAVVRAPDGSETTVSAPYLAGCDGGASLVRKEAGIGFPGFTDEHTVDRSALIAPSAALRLTGGNRVVVDGLGEIPAMFHRTERGVFNLLPHDPQRPLINTAEWERTPAGTYPGPGAPLTLAEVEDSVERVLGVRVPLRPPPDGAPTLLRRLCRRNSRQADRYRDGRIFLAGDAAHVSHGPTLNAALGDAANLGWKLAAAVRGRAPDGLLDTYEAERHPVAARIVAHTRAESALLAPGGDVTALREVFAELLTSPAAVRVIAETMAGATPPYLPGDGPGGRFVPPLTVGGRRLAELLHDARPAVLDPDGELAAVVEPWAGRVAHVVADPGTTALLVRPDGYVAWSGSDPDGPDGLAAALTRWFGPA